MIPEDSEDFSPFDLFIECLDDPFLIVFVVVFFLFEGITQLPKLFALLAQSPEDRKKSSYLPNSDDDIKRMTEQSQQLYKTSRSSYF